MLVEVSHVVVRGLDGERGGGRKRQTDRSAATEWREASTGEGREERRLVFLSPSSRPYPRDFPLADSTLSARIVRDCDQLSAPFVSLCIYIRKQLPWTVLGRYAG